MRIFRLNIQLKALVLCALILSALPAKAGDDDFRKALESSPSQLLVSGGDQPVEIHTNQVEVAEASNIKDIINLLPENSSRETLISTDSELVVEETLKAFAQRPDLKKPKFVFFGGILKAGKSFASGLKRGKDHVVDAIFRDKIGFTVTAINSVYDASLWIHASSFSTSQKASMIIFNTLLALSFNLDKDLWSKTVRPISNGIMNKLERFKLISSQATASEITQITSHFFASLSLTLGIQTARMGIISMDHLLAAIGTPQFWGSIAMMSTALTASGFLWSEHIASIDETTKPASKNLFRRFSEMRNLFMGHVAASSMLLQPNVYGFAPWAAVIGNGLVGLAVYLKRERISNWIEGRSFFKRLQTNYDKIDDAIDRKFGRGLAPIGFGLTCKQVYLSH